ncbi:MAG: DNA-binding response regulator [Candidatus Melainabacteria bacterium HGW-Melainabacteria-1]|jgi:DNA-binding response OmpR family regulator|nr:MAG: DNA-binding response regulator [Candidatus Melainabacteria bacterium HGW-Melainabacteria-1]PKQ20254.1 MAG: DNA-binding response regulator [Actinobacteria bacterium HGW-Actinobacteria-6]
MAEETVLIVEDDATIARFVELELEHAGFGVLRAGDGPTAIDLLESNDVALLILDLMLPGIDGIDVARHVRKKGSTVPILMLTARAETHDVVAGFEAGADDYLRKPFEIPELLSRVRALLKRARGVAAQTPYEASGIRIDPEKREASLDATPLDLTAKEFDLLAYLVANAGRVISRDEILETVWGGQHATDSNVIEVFVCHLRNKIGDKENKVIQTIRGVGYFFARA